MAKLDGEVEYFYVRLDGLQSHLQTNGFARKTEGLLRSNGSVAANAIVDDSYQFRKGSARLIVGPVVVDDSRKPSEKLANMMTPLVTKGGYNAVRLSIAVYSKANEGTK